MWRNIALLCLLVVVTTEDAATAFLLSPPISGRHASLQPTRKTLYSTSTSSSLDTTEALAPSIEGSTTREERSQVAKNTWKTIALAPTPSASESKRTVVDLQKESEVFRPSLFDEFVSIQGTYFLNGLASCQVGDRLVHPFEAHGLVKSLVFDGRGTLTMTGRLVATPLTQKESTSGRMQARGVMSYYRDVETLWGRLQNALSSQERDTANLVANLWPPPSTKTDQTSPPSLLVVCGDNGEPFGLDPKTLETKGKLVDLVPQVQPYLKGKKCIAHTRYDPIRNRFVLCTNAMNVPSKNKKENSDDKGDLIAASITVEFFEFDDKWNMVSSNSYETDSFAVFHDWQMTRDFYVVPLNPAKIVGEGLFEFLTGGTIGTDVFRMEEHLPGKFLLLARDPSKFETNEVEAGQFFNCFHFGPTFQMADEEQPDQLVIHGAVFDKYTFGGEMGFVGETQDFDPIAWGESYMAPPPRLDKFVIDTKEGKILERNRMDADGIPVDMPCFAQDMLPMKASYFLGAKRPEGWFPFRSVVKLDLETGRTCNWQAGDQEIVSEPMFVPRPPGTTDDIENGFVMSIVHDAETESCRLVIWDGPSFAEGPVATVPLGDLMPWCVHGSWEANYNP